MLPHSVSRQGKAMALRATQQTVGVLSEATGGKLRVTQYYIEAIGAPGTPESVSDTLSLSQTVAVATVYSRSISDPISFADVATFATTIYTRSLTDTMALTDSVAETTIWSRALTSTAAFADTATELNTHILSVANVLAFSDQALGPVIHTQSLSDVLALVDNAIGDDGLNQVINDTLAFSDSVATNLHSQALADTLALIDSAFAPHIVSSQMALVDSVITNIKAGVASDVLALSDVVLSNYHTIHDPISFVDVAGTNIKPQTAANAMTLTDTVTFVKIHNLADQLNVVDQVKRAITFPRTVASPIGFVQTVEMFIDRSGELCIYAPNVGSGPRTIPTTPPTITPSTLTLFWPVVSPSVTVVLRNPEFGNKVSYTPNRINRKSRGGKIMTFRDPDWPQFTLLDMNISMLNQTQIDNFKSFLQTTLGQVVGVIDHDGFVWNGVIITPDTAITQLSGTVSCPNYATSFQFEGQQVS
jgi:hypothetical protein